MRATLLFAFDVFLKVYLKIIFSAFSILIFFKLSKKRIYILAIYLECISMFYIDLQLRQEMHINENALLAAVSSRPTKIAHEFSMLF